MFRKPFIFFFVFSFALAACRENLPEKSSENYRPAIKSFYVGLAALQVGDDQRAGEELKKAAEAADGEPAVWNNLGVLQLRQKDYEAAAASLEKARTLAPGSAKIHSNLAVLEIQRGNFEKAVEHLSKTIEIEPNDVRAMYALAQEKERATADGEALRLYDRIAGTKPENLAVKLEIARLAAKLNQPDDLKRAVFQMAARAENFPPEAREQFEALRKTIDNPRQAATQISYLRNVLLREPFFRAAINQIKPSDTAVGEVFTKPLKLPAPDFSPAEPDANLTFAAQPTENARASFAKAAFLNGESPPVVLWSDEKQTRVGKTSLPVSAANPNQIAAFDFDYDFKNDLAFATEKGFRLFKQTDGENFADVTAETKLSNEILQKSYNGIWPFDVEADGDLDLILGSDADAIVLQNNSDGTFKEIKALSEASLLQRFSTADLDEDGDVDALAFSSFGTADFFENERGGIYKDRSDLLRQGLGEFSEYHSILAEAFGDADGDGKIDLVVFNDQGKLLRLSTESTGKLKAYELISVGGLECVEQTEAEKRLEAEVHAVISNCSLMLADLDNNGANDILISGGRETQILLGGKDAKFSLLPNKINGRIYSVTDANGDGKLDLIGTDADGKPTVFQNRSAKNYHWQILRPRAAKTEGDQRVNSFGIGGEMEIRAGLSAQKQIIDSPQIHFGLGENTSADVLRVVWGNGYVQAEFDLRSDQTVAAEQRLKGSCPHLFAWNGERFALVKDAPPWSPALGLKINAQDTYGILQTEEWFKIPGDALKARDGFYELRITGEYWESFYIDQYELLAVDHPAETEVFTDERFAVPLPPLKVFTTEKTHPFASAKNDRGEDVAETVRALDEKYLDRFERGTFQGVAKEHFVELELPSEAPSGKKMRLVGDGWVHPTDASINVQMGQSSLAKPKSLSLEIEDENGNWRVVKENLGFPAGKMKTILIDLPENVKRLRLRTNMEIFWDKLAWTIDVAEPQALENRLSLSSAELRYRGFSVIEKRDASSPEKPIYDKILTTSQRWRDLEGFYTRFGDIKELLSQVDDRFVLANAGDEIVLKFAALPEPPAGWTRDFVIIGNGWIKDGDLNSVFSKTLLPLPTHRTNDYTRPPARLEDDPVFRKNRRDWLDFHTRYVAPDMFRSALRGE